MGIVLNKVSDQRPSVVFGAIIDEHNFVRFSYLAAYYGTNPFVQLFETCRLIIAGNHYGEARRDRAVLRGHKLALGLGLPSCGRVWLIFSKPWSLLEWLDYSLPGPSRFLK
jgi:hypothetical protein